LFWCVHTRARVSQARALALAQDALEFDFFFGDIQAHEKAQTRAQTRASQAHISQAHASQARALALAHDELKFNFFFSVLTSTRKGTSTNTNTCLSQKHMPHKHVPWH
jgi:hypothetical protein